MIVVKFLFKCITPGGLCMTVPYAVRCRNNSVETAKSKKRKELERFYNVISVSYKIL